jgi:hypothetical protein
MKFPRCFCYVALTITLHTTLSIGQTRIIETPSETSVDPPEHSSSTTSENAQRADAPDQVSSTTGGSQNNITPGNLMPAGTVSLPRIAALNPLPPFLARDFRTRAAYLDAVNILSQDNSCSRFFGGSQSILVLNELVERLERRSLDDETIGIKMHGGFQTYLNSQTGLSYRLFRRVMINSNGPFYANLDLKPLRISVGRFSSHRREARVLMLLHELAHLIRKTGTDHWLIPDDSHDHRLSQTNNLTIERECRAQLLELY